MPTVTISRQTAAWDCKWSRAGFRLAGIDESLQPESTWVCVRTGHRRKLGEHTCDACPYWEEEDFRKN